MNVLLIIVLVVLAAWIALNAYIGVTKTTNQMKYAFIKGQNFVGIIFTNTFFCLAWAIQMVKGLWRCRDEHGFLEKAQ